jgi:hypothetical protein
MISTLELILDQFAERQGDKPVRASILQCNHLAVAFAEQYDGLPETPLLNWLSSHFLRESHGVPVVTDISPVLGRVRFFHSWLAFFR